MSNPPQPDCSVAQACFPASTAHALHQTFRALAATAFCTDMHSTKPSEPSQQQPWLTCTDMHSTKPSEPSQQQPWLTCTDMHSTKPSEPSQQQPWLTCTDMHLPSLPSPRSNSPCTAMHSTKPSEPSQQQPWLTCTDIGIATSEHHHFLSSRLQKGEAKASLFFLDRSWSSSVTQSSSCFLSSSGKISYAWVMQPWSHSTYTHACTHTHTLLCNLCVLVGSYHHHRL